MARVSAFLQTLFRNRKGATAVEYGLIVALIVIVMVAALQAVAERNTSIWNNVADKVIKAR